MNTRFQEVLEKLILFPTRKWSFLPEWNIKKHTLNGLSLYFNWTLIHLIISLAFLKTDFNACLSSTATQALEKYQQSMLMQCYTNHCNAKAFGSNLNILSLPWILPYLSPPLPSKTSISKWMCYVNSSDNHLHLKDTDYQILSPIHSAAFWKAELPWQQEGPKKEPHTQRQDRVPISSLKEELKAVLR